MSAALYLKQNIYQLTSEDLVQILKKYYTANMHAFAVSTTQKAYKCFECCIMVDSSKYCAGFGRNEEEATLNAGRIALESIIDSGDTIGIKKFIEPEEEKSELECFLNEIEAGEYLGVFQKEKVGFEDLGKLNSEGLRLLLPPGLASKVFSHFHPVSGELNELREQNEKLQGLLHLRSPPKYLLCPISHELLEEPVTTSDGHTYERKAIEAWLANHCTSPITGLPLPDKILKPNFAIKMALQEYKDVLLSMNIRPSPILISNPLRDLYKTAYGHQFGVPFADITNEKIGSLRSKAENLINGSQVNIKYF